jgi:hypothetical protein
MPLLDADLTEIMAGRVSGSGENPRPDLIGFDSVIFPNSVAGWTSDKGK